MSASAPRGRATIEQCAAALGLLATASRELPRRLGCPEVDPHPERLADRASALSRRLSGDECSVTIGRCLDISGGRAAC